jgi:ribonuclease H
MVIKVYTDGACSGNPGPGGWGVVFSNGENIKCLSGGAEYTTNNQMELRAVVEALNKILQKFSNESRFEVISDSSYVVNAINQKWLKKWEQNGWKTRKHENVKNKNEWLELLSALKELKKLKYEVRFIKVKGHSGNVLNEKADSLAVEESRKRNVKWQK